MKKTMYTNILHRLWETGDNFTISKMQQEMCHNLGIRTTLFMSYESLQHKELIDFAKEQLALGDEIGITFNDFNSADMTELCKTKERMIYMCSHESRAIIVTTLFEKFYKKFGFYPKSVASYVMDAPLVKFIKEKYPTVIACITNCFEEGVNMFNGNNFSWNLFSDGGPWSAYYPSKFNALKPASCEEESLDVVGFPHLNRDMILALTSRDDYFASHPPNVIRAKANDGATSPYMLRFIDQWISQAELNGFSYFNTFVSSGWLGNDNIYVESSSDSVALYQETLSHLAKRAKEGKVEFCTMSEFAQLYKQDVEIGSGEVNLWNDILCGTKRQMFWYVDPYFRGAFDLNSGGELRDLRPYAGAISRNVGVDGDSYWDGNYPYLLSYEHRTWTFYTSFLHYKGKRVSVSDKRSKCNVTKENGKFVMTVDPITVYVGEEKFTITTKYLFMGEGKIQVTRKLLEAPLGAKPLFEEQFRGLWGSTEYPEDMRSITLSCGDEKECESLDYNYMTRTVERLGTYSKMSIGVLNSDVILQSEEQLTCGFEEGSCMNAYYHLWLKKELSMGEEFVSWLTIKKKS